MYVILVFFIKSPKVTPTEPIAGLFLFFCHNSLLLYHDRPRAEVTTPLL